MTSRESPSGLMLRAPARRWLAVAIAVWGGLIVPRRDTHAADAPAGPRAAAWKRVEQALEEGRPKTAVEAVAGSEQAATADRAWAEGARAIASRHSSTIDIP